MHIVAAQIGRTFTQHVGHKTLGGVCGCRRNLMPVVDCRATRLVWCVFSLAIHGNKRRALQRCNTAALMAPDAVGPNRSAPRLKQN